MMRLFIGLMVVALAGLLWEWSQPFEPSITDDKACADGSTAWAVARVIVRENLSRSLSTKFPNRSASGGLEGMSFHYLGDCRHKISAFVDTYHRRDGLARRYFTVELSYHGRSGWLLDQLDFTAPPNS